MVVKLHCLRNKLSLRNKVAPASYICAPQLNETLMKASDRLNLGLRLVDLRLSLDISHLTSYQTAVKLCAIAQQLVRGYYYYYHHRGYSERVREPFFR